VDRDPIHTVTAAEEHMKLSCNTTGRSTGRNVTAFTLVELLVVIGIIALLISILLPTLASVRQSASAIKCRSNLKQIGTGIYMYAQANNGLLPYGFVFTGATIPGEPNWTEESNDWTTLVYRFMTQKAGTGYDTQQLNTVTNSGTRGIFLCPDVARENTTAAFVSHYSSHPRIIPDLSGNDWDTGVSTKGLKPYTLAGIKRASEIAMIFDAPVVNASYQAPAVGFAIDRGAVYRRPYLLEKWSNSLQPIGPSDSVDMRPWSTTVLADYNTDRETNPGNIRFRHSKDSAANVLMVDGHVATFRYNKQNRVTDLLRKNIYVNPR
jgi:prepilin-type processing-associated H-X9-DG protein